MKRYEHVVPLMHIPRFPFAISLRFSTHVIWDVIVNYDLTLGLAQVTPAGAKNTPSVQSTGSGCIFTDNDVKRLKPTRP
jgi:hypothetical protein